MFLDRVRKALNLKTTPKPDPQQLQPEPSFSATQNCDVKVSSARANDIEMVPPEHR